MCCRKHQTAFFLSCCLLEASAAEIRLQAPQPVAPLHPLTSPFIAPLSPAQFDGAADRPAKEETAHATLPRQPRRPLGPQQQQQQHLRQKSWTQKMLRSSPTSGTDAEACRVDPSLPLQEQRSAIVYFFIEEIVRNTKKVQEHRVR